MRPIGICTTPSEDIIVADAARQAVVIFDAEGHLMVELHQGTEAWSGWTLPTGLACLSAKPQVMPDGTQQTELGEWVVVSDMLGKNGLTLLHVAKKHEAVTSHTEGQ